MTDFDAADHAIERTADDIATRIAALLKKTERNAVASAYVVEQLIVVLLRKHPEVLAWLDRQRGEGNMRLSEALKDWLELWDSR